MAQNVICEGHDLERSMSQVKTNGTVGFLDLKNIALEVKIILISASVQKLWSKTAFCIMVTNVKHSHMSHIKTAQYIFNLLKGPNQDILC